MEWRSGMAWELVESENGEKTSVERENEQRMRTKRQLKVLWSNSGRREVG